MSALRLLVVDDHAVVRRGVRALLESRPGWEICGEAVDGQDAIRKAADLKPDIVVLDISLPGLNGLEATSRILKESPKSEVLILTMHHSEELAQQVIKAGARGYVLKSDADQSLVAAIDKLSQHQTFFTSRVAEFVLDSGARGENTRRAVEDPSRRMTSRERQIAQHEGGCIAPRNQRQDGRGAPDQHHEKAASSLSQRARSLRYPERNRPAVEAFLY